MFQNNFKIIIFKWGFIKIIIFKCGFRNIIKVRFNLWRCWPAFSLMITGQPNGLWKHSSPAEDKHFACGAILAWPFFAPGPSLPFVKCQVNSINVTVLRGYSQGCHGYHCTCWHLAPHSLTKACLIHFKLSYKLVYWILCKKCTAALRSHTCSAFLYSHGILFLFYFSKNN